MFRHVEKLSYAAGESIQKESGNMFSYCMLKSAMYPRKSCKLFAIIYMACAIVILSPIFANHMVKNWGYNPDARQYLNYIVKNCQFSQGQFDLPNVPGLDQEEKFHLGNYAISEVKLAKTTEIDQLSIPSVTVYSIGDNIVYHSMMSGKVYIILNLCRYMLLLFLAAETVTSFLLGATMLWKTI